MSPSIKQQLDDLQGELCRDVDALRTLAELIELNGHRGGETLRTPAEQHIGIGILLSMVADSVFANIDTMGECTVAARHLEQLCAEQARRERQPLSTREGMVQHAAQVFCMAGRAGIAPTLAEPDSGAGNSEPATVDTLNQHTATPQ